MQSQMSVHSYKTLDVNKINVSPIDPDKLTFKTPTGFMYGKIEYNGAPLVIHFNDYELSTDLISQYSDKVKAFYKEGPYDRQRFKAYMPLKNYPDFEQKLIEVSNFIHSKVEEPNINIYHVKQIEKYKKIKNNDTIKLKYYDIVKRPDIIKKMDEDKYKGKDPEEILKEIGTNIKIDLPVIGKKINDGKSEVYKVEYNEHSQINCIIKTKGGIKIDKKNHNLDFYSQTFKRGAIIDFGIKINNWWIKPLKDNIIEMGVKCSMAYIVLKKESLFKGGAINYINEDGLNIFDGCDDDNDEDEKEEKK